MNLITKEKEIGHFRVQCHLLSLRFIYRCIFTQIRLVLKQRKTSLQQKAYFSNQSNQVVHWRYNYP